VTWGPSEPDAEADPPPVATGPQYGWTQQYAPAPAPAYDPTRSALPYAVTSAWDAAPAVAPPVPVGAHAYRDPWAAPTREEQAWATAAHWLPLMTHWVGPLVVLLTVGRRSDCVRTEAAASLNWEITVAVLLAVSVALARFGVLGPVVAIAVALFSIGMHIIGAVTASRGGSFVYPLALPIVR
jgi:uncharacterized Tic20 family protein